MMATPRFCIYCGKGLRENFAPENNELDGPGSLPSALLISNRNRLACPDLSCGYVFYDNPLPVVAALVEYDGHVLLVQNKGWPEKWFGLVTGFLERGETPEQAVLRELAEELGLQGEMVQLIGVYPFVEKNEVIVAYHVKASGQVRLGSEIVATKAIDPDKLRPWPFGTGHAVRDWLAKREPRS